MIKLDVHEYCQDCTEFEPRITQRPEKLNIGFSDFCICGDTIIECEYRKRCDAIHNYLKKEKSNGVVE